MRGKLGILTAMPENLTPISDAEINAFAAHESHGVSDVPTQSTQPGQSRLASRRFLAKRWQKVAFGLSVVVLLFGSIAAVLGLYTYQVVQTIKVQANDAETLGRQAYDSFKGQNLPATQAGLQSVQGKMAELRTTYERLGFYRYIPVASAYYADGTHGLNAADAGIQAALTSIEAINPYADVLGFTGEGTFVGGTAEDRLKLVLQTLDKVSPQLDEIAANLQTADAELSQINENRYPESIGGTAIRPMIIQAKSGSQGAVQALTEYRPVLEELTSIAGGRGQRKKYLILFQNDNELRPTGGFLTAYSIIYIEDGKVTPDKSDDIYELDKKFAKRLPIPDSLGRYLTTERYWNLRDMNISPDFKLSMDQFLENYKTVRGEPQDIDGIIALDTHVLTELLTVLGPVEVPGYGTFSAENSPACDCPQVVHALSEIITRPTPYLREDRKGILGPMMRAILTKSYGAPRQQWPQLVEIGLKNIAGRHAQMYFFDEKAQAAAEKINAGGRMIPPTNGEDFLAIVDANLGGAKSNLYVNYDVKQTVSAPENGQITKTVEITYRNSRRSDNCNLEAGLLCLNSTLRDWSRIYLPAGSKLTEANGFTEAPRQYDEAGFSVVDGFFILEPNSQAKLRLSYTVPYQDATTYRVKLWKQGGLNPIPMFFDVNGSEEEITVDKDTTFEAAF